MKIDSHEKLTWSKVGELIKGNTRGNKISRIAKVT
jgi:hypothetical protein